MASLLLPLQKPPSSASRLFAVLIAGSVCSPHPTMAQQFDAQMCKTVLQNGIHDTYSVFSEKQRFEQYQSQLCDSRFESYEQLSNASGKLGFSLPLAEGLLGIDARAKTSSAKFREQYSNFCTSSFSEQQASSRYQENKSNINANILRTFSKCVEMHKEAYLKQRGVFVEISPFDRSASFLMKITVFPRGDFSGVRIDNIQPDNLVKCTHSAQPVRLGQTIINKVDFTLNCTKPKDQAIPLILETNYGNTETAITIPAYEEPVTAVVAPKIGKRDSESSSGRVVFDYSTNSGRVIVGSGSREFTMSFTMRDSRTIYVYTHGTDIDRIARVASTPKGTSLRFEDFDSTSYVYHVAVGDLVLVKNKNGYFMQTRIVSVKSVGYDGDTRPEVVFDYQINGDRVSTFTAL